MQMDERRARVLRRGLHRAEAEALTWWQSARVAKRTARRTASRLGAEVRQLQAEVHDLRRESSRLRALMADEYAEARRRWIQQFEAGQRRPLGSCDKTRLLMLVMLRARALLNQLNTEIGKTGFGGT